MSQERGAPAVERATGLRGGVARRASWGLTDQILSSASNFALSAFVAAEVGVAAFGAFTLVYGIYNFVVGFSEGFASSPLIVRFSAAPTERRRAGTRASVGAALAAGALAGVVCMAASPLATGAVSGPLLALGVVLPGLLVQDAWRYAFVAAGRPAQATANDGLWVGLQLLGIVGLLVAGRITAVSMVLVWGGSANVAALVGCRQAGMLPAPMQVRAWLREQRTLTWRYGAEALVHRSGAWLALALVGAVAGLRVVAALRGAMLLMFGPLNLLFTGATFVFTAEIVRLLHRAPRRVPRAIRSVSGAAIASALAWSAVVLVLPDGIGSRVLGATWHTAKPLLPLLVLAVVAVATSLGPIQGLLAFGAARRSLFTQLVGLGVQLPSVVGAAALFGARGAALATGLSECVRTLVAWTQFGRASAEPPASAPPAPPEPALAEAMPG